MRSDDTRMNQPAAGHEDPQRKKEEFRTWVFLALVMAPVLAVVIVSAYGFGVWMYQVITGPMTL
jgi:nitrate reductase NapE